MSIILKPNSRLKLISSLKTSLKFQIDGKNELVFQARREELHFTLLKFITNGASLASILENNNLFWEEKIRALQFIENLKKNKFIDCHIKFQNEICAIVSPMIQLKKIKLSEINSNFYTLSRFSFLREDNGKIQLENPCSSFGISFDSTLLIDFLPVLCGKKKLKDTSEFNNHELEFEILFTFMIQGNMVKILNHLESEHLLTWEFHDLLFHSRSRLGSYDDKKKFGATYRFKETLPAPPTFKTINVESQIKLYKPSIEDLNQTDISFSKVLESRRSIRTQNSENPINLKKLGEFLFRSVGIREFVETLPQSIMFRPYPSAGALHEVEVYVINNNCAGLVEDIYLYNPSNHSLQGLEAKKDHIKDIMKSSLGNNSILPQVFIILTSRFQKISWKYERMAYRSTLITIGAIFQTMSLVATAMNLASCIIGSGDSNLFAEAAGLDPLKEGAVGEFILGSAK